MKLPESQRDKLKAPLGILLSGANRERVIQEIPDGSRVITVGDRTTERMLEFGMQPSLMITDGKERREIRRHPDIHNVAAQGQRPITTIDVDNPPAEITQSSIGAVRRAFSIDGPVWIRVNGEEDLLVLPACVYAPDDSVVLYGQPGKGLVVTRITDEVRNKTKKLLELMDGTRHDDTVAV